MPRCCPCPDSGPTETDMILNEMGPLTRAPRTAPMVLHQGGPAAATGMRSAPMVSYSSAPSASTSYRSAPPTMTSYSPSPSASTSYQAAPMVLRGGGGARAMSKHPGMHGLGQDAAPSGSVFQSMRALWQMPIVRFAAVLAVGYALIRPSGLKFERSK